MRMSARCGTFSQQSSLLPKLQTFPLISHDLGLRRRRGGRGVDATTELAPRVPLPGDLRVTRTGAEIVVPEATQHALDHTVHALDRRSTVLINDFFDDCRGRNLRGFLVVRIFHFLADIEARGDNA